MPDPHPPRIGASPAAGKAGHDNTQLSCLVGPVFVLWWRYSGGSENHFERAYFDRLRAEQDFALVKQDTSCDWFLTTVPLWGRDGPLSDAENPSGKAA